MLTARCGILCSGLTHAPSDGALVHALAVHLQIIHVCTQISPPAILHHSAHLQILVFPRLV